MTTLDPRWRPSDADRDAYSAVIATAYEEGRITSDDMQARTELVYEAQRIADLDAVVEGLPGAPNTPAARPPPKPAPAPKKSSRVGPAFLAVAVIVGGITIARGGEEPAATPPPSAEVDAPEEPPEPVAEVWPEAPVPEIDTELIAPLSQEHIQEVMDATTAAGIEQIQETGLYPDGSARLTVAAEGDIRALDDVDVDGGAVSNRSEGRPLSDMETDDVTYFGWDDVDAATIAKAVVDSPAQAGVDAPVEYVSVSRTFNTRHDVMIIVHIDNRSPWAVAWTDDGEFIQVMD